MKIQQQSPKPEQTRGNKQAAAWKKKHGGLQPTSYLIY